MVASASPAAATHEHIADVGVADRSIQAGEAFFSTRAVACHLHLPTGDIFDLELDLRVTLVPTLYLVETGAWGFAEERMIKNGLSRVYSIEAGSTRSGGSVQMNARAQVSTTYAAATEGR